MAAEIFTAISALRMVLESETDADSPDNETTFAAIRVAIESLFLILLGTGFDGTVSGISTTTITHADAAQSVDVHNGRTTLMTSGACKGNFYTIDDCAAQTLIHDGDDPEADGVIIGDTFQVLYDIKVNLDGHDHDTVNAKGVVLGTGVVEASNMAANSVDSDSYVNLSIDAAHYAAGSIPKTAINTATGTSSAAISTTNWYSVELQDYCFSPNICGTGQYFHVRNYSGVVEEWSAKFAVYNADGGTQTYTVHYRYITSSDEPFLYVIRDGDTGVILGTWACADPPARYWGLDEKPNDFIPPLIPSHPPTNMEEIVIFKYPKEEYLGLVDKASMDKTPIHELIDNDYDYDSGKKLFVTKNLATI